MCKANEAKFTCPKCEVRTCSLKCVKVHKIELKCDGVRDKTKYIPVQCFTDLDFLSGKVVIISSQNKLMKESFIVIQKF